MNPIKNKPIAEQKQIAEKQRQAEELRKKNLKQSIEEKKKLIRTQSETFKQR